MHNLGLTDLESLEDEKLVIPGLDVDAALDKTVTRGKKIVRNRRIGAAFSSTMILILILGVVFSILPAIRSGSNGGETKLVSAIKVETPKPTTPSTAAPTVATAPPTTATVLTPTLVSIREFGNKATCDVMAYYNATSTTAPVQYDENGNPIQASGLPLIGSAARAQRFNARIGQTFSVDSTSEGRRISMKVVQSNQATGGAYIDLVSGYLKSGYANVTTLGMTYCEPGLKLEIKPEANGQYTIYTEAA